MSFFYKLTSRLIKLFQSLRYDKYRVKYNIPIDFRFNGKDISIYGDGELLIGKNSYIGSYSTIQLHEKTIVSIGNGCSISHNVRMYTSSKIPDYDFSDKLNAPDKIGNIVIDDYVWIGANVFINPGVKIGKNSVVGANSVVTKDIVSYGIYGAVPAKLIRMNRIDV